ncbi:hypothetical protein SCHPADRAFT_995938 [Schizopora paradoxa]|uniref:DUF6533 domain-containing protein n=1 Tax=Schizopora paradoxa TaxID=27342 RepID=A0A0H2SE51_9AGAM|nr:hypothetical protein SCHPADRAFT_995938 [Schizopora paradoxa]
MLGKDLGVEASKLHLLGWLPRQPDPNTCTMHSAPFDPTLAIMLAACTLFMYDAVLSIDDEVFCFWSRPWLWGKIAFVGTRAICLGFVLATIASGINILNQIDKSKLDNASAYFGATQFIFIILVYVSSQAVLGSRVYALYGNKPAHLIGLICVCCILPAIVTIVESAFNLAIDDPSALLYTYDVLGLMTDVALFTLIMVHAFRSPTNLTFYFKASRKSSTSPGESTVSRGDTLLSLMISDSIIYYFAAVLMYTTTFIIGAVNIRVPIIGRLAENNVQFDVALVSMMTVLTGINAPKLLLSVRKEFYRSASRIG